MAVVRSALLSALALTCTWEAAGADQTLSATNLSVAAVQMRSTRDLTQNVERVCGAIADCATNGVRVAVFPECALTGYFADVVTNLAPAQIGRAEERVAQACQRAGIYAIVGSAYRDGEKLFDSALVIAPSGQVLERYHKVQLAEDWPQPGDHLAVFSIDGIKCSIIICHDERYPELVRLPVLAGARVIFYLSHESSLREESKLNPYRAQIQARAVENTVYVVHANAPANADGSGSHGQSRIISPDGNIVQEASMFGQDVLRANLDLRKATADNARGSLNRGPLRDWWKEGLAHVRVIE